MQIINITKLQEKIQDFAKNRDWEVYHTPKNLSMALSVEASELVEIFQWLTEKESFDLVMSNKKKERVADELADIMVYAVRMADIMNIDLSSAIESKIKKNSHKYPVHKARGNAKKYDEFD